MPCLLGVFVYSDSTYNYRDKPGGFVYIEIGDLSDESSGIFEISW